MSEVIYFGRFISLLFAILIYACVWSWSVNHCVKSGKNEKWEIVISRAILVLHFVIIILFFVWCWTV